MLKIAQLVWLALACTSFTWAQARSAVGTPVRIMVTVGHNYGHESPTLTKNYVIVTELYEPLPVTNLISLRDDRADLELFVLIDDSSHCESGSQFEELRRFIGSQLSTAAVGVAYIEGGRVQVAKSPMQDHERASKLLSAPTGSKPASPFGALMELIQGWRQGSSRRAVLLISHGIDPAATDTLPDPSAEATIEAAQRAAVTVYAIYHPSADYLTNDSSKSIQGRLSLPTLRVKPAVRPISWNWRRCLLWQLMATDRVWIRGQRSGRFIAKD